MGKRSVRRDPVGTIRRDDLHDALLYAVRWHENPDMGWRVVNVVAGGEHLASDSDVKHWTVLYRPGMAKVSA